MFKNKAYASLFGGKEMLSTFLKYMPLNDTDRHVMYRWQSCSRQPQASFQLAEILPPR